MERRWCRISGGKRKGVRLEGVEKRGLEVEDAVDMEELE